MPEALHYRCSESSGLGAVDLARHMRNVAATVGSLYAVCGNCSREIYFQSHDPLVPTLIPHLAIGVLGFDQQ